MRSATASSATGFRKLLFDVFFQPAAEFGYLLRSVAHEDGTHLVSLELRRDAVHGAQGSHGDEFALGRRELVGSVDVAVTWPFISRGSFDPARS